MCVFEGGTYSGREYSGGKYSGAPCTLIATEPLRCRCTAPTSPGLVGDAPFALYTADGETLGSGTVRPTISHAHTHSTTHARTHARTHPTTHAPTTHTPTHPRATSHPLRRLTCGIDDGAATTPYSP